MREISERKSIALNRQREFQEKVNNVTKKEWNNMQKNRNGQRNEKIGVRE